MARSMWLSRLIARSYMVLRLVPARLAIRGLGRRYRRLLSGMLVALIMVVAAPQQHVLAGQPALDTLMPSACPMAHCDPQMSDNEPIAVPTITATVTWAITRTGVINGSSLGCTTGAAIVICVGTNTAHSSNYDRPYVYGFDAQTGHTLWNSGTLLNGMVSQGAPLIDSAGNCYVSDNNYIASFDVTGTLRWRVSNPAHTPMISPSMTADGYLVGQGLSGLFEVVNPTNGAIAGTLLLRGMVAGQAGTYVTLNTVSLSTNRVYVVTQFSPAMTPTIPLTGSVPGRLYAIDVVGGVPQVAWHWDFMGTSGGSPLTVASPGVPTIYFDGSGQKPGDPAHPWLFAVRDLGSAPALLWAVDFTATFGSPYIAGIQASPMYDRQGGVWVWITGDSRLFRFSTDSGALLQLLDVNTLLGSAGYTPSGVLSTAYNSGRPVMFVGAQSAQPAPIYMMAVDLDSGTSLWRLTLGAGSGQSFPGQTALAAVSGNVIAVEPRRDGLILGLRLG